MAEKKKAPAKKAAAKKSSKVKVGARYGGQGAYKGISTKEIKQLVNANIRAEVRKLQSQNKLNLEKTKQDIARAREDQKRTAADLKHISGQVGSFLGNLNEQRNTNYANTMSQAEAANAALLNQIGGISQSQRAATQGELNQFGLNQNRLTAMDAQSALNQQLAAQSGANELSNLRLMQAGDAGVGSMFEGMNQGQLQSSLGRSINTRDDTIRDSRDVFKQSRQAIQNSINEARSNRTRDLMNALNDRLSTDYQMWLTQEQMKRASSGGGGGGGYRGGSSYGGYGSGSGSTSSADALLEKLRKDRNVVVNQPPNAQNKKPGWFLNELKGQGLA